MGMETGTALLIGSLITAGAAAATTMSMPVSPKDATDYDLLRRTQEAADAESAEARARIEEARKREELRQQQLVASGIITSDAGTQDLAVRNQVLGTDDEEE